MNKFKITIDGKNYEVTVNETAQNTAQVEVNGNSYNVRYESENTTTVTPPLARKQTTPAAPQATAPAAPQPGAAGSATIKAPLPGTITSINVSVGAEVKRGDVLIIMEAMKMENNIMANKDGRIKAIRVTAGQTVAQDEPLIDLE